MTAETNSARPDHQGRKVIYRSAASAPVYGMGFIGALIYFIQHAATFWAGVLGIFKAVFWPAMLVYKMLEYLKM
jgi:hypothetical protein